ncbi:probable serine/threonine-protein kinase At1g54610 isoform X2 [Telopea speciosissima]|uniref:probable serine/threonine-protein kinase At1g54610 isoform X2 n=1 Tax=Telopea speciosissima TaxID=54955 RepID=UPI001CC3EF9B|nr:probable serine/threonine-protein kinase At1g54610 isoform X2 [Telopea speciosissima]
MGCVLGREVSSVVGSDVREKEKEVDREKERTLSVPSGRKLQVSVSTIETTEVQNGENQKEENQDGSQRSRGERRRSKQNPRLSNPPKNVHGEQVAAGWPSWLSAVAGEAINGWTPRRADTFEKLDKIGQGTYSNVYKARDTLTGKIVALKKVRFDNLEPESVKFMAREILILRRLDHPNVVKLEGLVTSRMSCSLYLVFEYMEHDLAGLAASPGIKFTESQVEQLHKIFKLCGSPSEEYWKKSKLPHATIFKPQQPYKRCIAETFKDFPPSSLPLIETLLAIDPVERLTATDALNSEFFTTKPYACEPSSLPKYPPSKEMDAKLRDEEARRLRAAGRANGDGVKKTRARDRAVRAYPAPEANAELQANLDRRRLISHANAKSKSEKFPPPHQDGALGFPLGTSHHIDSSFDPPDVPFSSTALSYSKGPIQTWSGPLVDPAAVGAPRRKKHGATDARASIHPSKAHKDKRGGVRVKA